MWELVTEVRAGATMWYVEENRRVQTQVRVGAMMWGVCMQRQHTTEQHMIGPHYTFAKPISNDQFA